MQNVSAILASISPPAGDSVDPAQAGDAFSLAFEGDELEEAAHDRTGDAALGCSAGQVMLVPVWAGLAGLGRFEAGARGPAEIGEAAENGTGGQEAAEPGRIPLIKPAPYLSVDPDLGSVLTGQPAEADDLPSPSADGEGFSSHGERLPRENPVSDIAPTEVHPLPSGRGADGWRPTSSGQLPEIGKAIQRPNARATVLATESVTGGPASAVAQAVKEGPLADGAQMSDLDLLEDVKPVERQQPVSAFPLPQLTNRGETSRTPADQAGDASGKAPKAALESLAPNATSGGLGSNPNRIDADATPTVPDIPVEPQSPGPFSQIPVGISATNSHATSHVAAIAGTGGAAPYQSSHAAQDALATKGKVSGLPDGATPVGPGMTLDLTDTLRFGAPVAAPTDTVRKSDASGLPTGPDSAGAQSGEGAGTAAPGPAAEDRDPVGLLPGAWERLFNGVMVARPAGQDTPLVAASTSVVPPEQGVRDVPSGWNGREDTRGIDPGDQPGHPAEGPRVAAPSEAAMIARAGAGLAPQAADGSTRPADDVDPLDDSAVPFLTATGAALPVSAQAVSPSQGPTTLPVPHIAAQINAALAQNADGSTDLALSPEELGKVRLKLKPDAGNPDRMVVMITFERPETLDLFRRHAGELADALRSAGYAGADIGFSQEGSFASGSDRREGRSSPAASPIHPAPSDPSPAPARLMAGASLDLRL